MDATPTRERLTEFFHSVYRAEPQIIARAPGRVEFIGNHTDYNGGLVVGAAIDRSLFVAVSPRTDGKLRFASEFSAGVPEREQDTLEKFEGKQAWANYPLGVFAHLRRHGLDAGTGFNLAIASDLPSGAGLSSSAALEMGVGSALTALYGIALSKEEMVRLGRAVENDFLGVPTGPLDQTCSAFGKANKLVYIDCRTLDVELLPFPEQCRIQIFNSGVRHSLVDSLYSKRHDECIEALRLLRLDHPDFEYLTDADEKHLETLPADTPADVVKRARHVIRENERVRAAKSALFSGDLDAVGRLLVESHHSSRTLFENSCPELDTLVDLLARSPNVHGARLSGGGFGGTVIALTSLAFGEDDARTICDDYEKAHGNRPDTLACTTAEGAEVLG